MRRWQTAPRELTLAGDEVHVWRAALDALRPEDFLETLSAGERGRANRFRQEEDRRRFIAAHGALRDILARYLRTAPAALDFQSGPRGKPHLAGELRFNLSHSGGLALCAVALGREVGVDVERIRPHGDLAGIAARFFSAEEQAALDASAPETFYRCWTRKEAYLKATGLGLQDLSGSPPDPSRWSVIDLEPGAGYAAAVAIEARAAVRLFEYAPQRAEATTITS